ncbi:MAG: 50S ribosomal protein L18e [Candidatus Bathyarchaeia archaeon]
MKKVRTTNPELIRLTRLLKKQSKESNTAVWKKIAEILAKPRRKRVAVNLSRINRYTQKSDVIVVPGKVLGNGVINHSVTVAAFDFSEKAKEKILAAKGKCISIIDLVKKNPKGANVKVIG